VPVQIVDVGPGLSSAANPPIVQVTLSGSAAQLATLDAQSLVVTISVSGQGAGVYSLIPSLALPSGVTLVGEPPAVTVVLRLPPSPTAIPVAPTPTPEEPTPTPEEPTAIPEEPTAIPPEGPTATPEEPAAPPTETPQG
jgi:hypothetical protein